jgi:DegV family protein with EDD domain
MNQIAIVTDSTADFAGVDITRLALTIVPLTVNWGRDVLRDRIDITTPEFYTRLRTDRELPHTAAPPVGIFEEVYRNLLNDHEAVISIHIASLLSGTFHVAESAARAVDGARIHVVDSTSTSLGLGWLAHHAAQLAEDGADPATILAALHGMTPRLRLYVALDSLDYLQRGGRIGRAQAFLGGLLNVKPIILVKDGVVYPVERVRTRTSSFRRLAEISAEAGAKERVAVAHGDAQTDADTLRQQVMTREGLTSVPVAEVGAVIGTHAGPGLIGVGFLLAD